MTLKEAIKHCEDVSKEQYNAGCYGCASEHNQLAKWLKELQELKENKVSS